MKCDVFGDGPMRIAVFGLGYVGLVTAVCLSADGHEVVGVETDTDKLERLRRAVSPFREPGVQDLLQRVTRSRSLTFTDDGGHAVSTTDLALICVGTPSAPSGGTDLTAVLSVTSEVAGVLRSEKERYSVILRSTVPPGSLRKHVEPALSRGAGRQVGAELELHFYPEFLRQGSAVADFHDPPFVVIGTHDGRPPPPTSVIHRIHPSRQAKPVVLNYQEAELLKVACNAFHALKIDFANEIGTIARHVGADPGRVMDAFVADNKLNVSASYLRPGFAFGGSCLPKEVRSLNHLADTHGLQLPVTQAILPSNDAHLDRIADDLVNHGRGTVGMVGITFKSNTDDLRESAAMRLIKRLRLAGRDVVVYEPELQVESLLGANLRYLQEVLPDYVDRLVDWSAMCERASVVLVTRAGVVTPAELAKTDKPVIEIDRLMPVGGEAGK